MHAAGSAVALLGVLLAARSAQLLAGRGRPRRGPRPPLVIAGPYLRVRNPLLVGLIVALAGLALATASGWIAAGALAALVIAHLWVTRVEEPRLRARFGEAYAEYVRRVPRWLPRGRRPAES